MSTISPPGLNNIMRMTGLEPADAMHTDLQSAPLTNSGHILNKSGRQVSNLQPTIPKTVILPIELPPENKKLESI